MITIKKLIIYLILLSIHLFTLSSVEFFSDKIKYSDYKLLFIFFFIITTFSAVTISISIILSSLSLLSSLLRFSKLKQYFYNRIDIIGSKFDKLLELLGITEIYNIRLYLVLGYVAFAMIALIGVTHFYIDKTGTIVPSVFIVSSIFAFIFFVIPWFTGKFLDLFMKKNNIE